VTGDAAPLVLTLTLDAASQAGFDTLRSACFPADRLVVGAHVTLFHALPSNLEMHGVGQEAAATGRFPVEVSDLRLLGRGVAFALESAPLRRLHDRFRSVWAARLSAQDRQPWQPHVTIQNKVEPAKARALHRALADRFVPYTVMATGLALWRYRNGPWEEAGRFPFRT